MKNENVKFEYKSNSLEYFKDLALIYEQSLGEVPLRKLPSREPLGEVPLRKIPSREPLGEVPVRNTPSKNKFANLQRKLPELEQAMEGIKQGGVRDFYNKILEIKEILENDFFSREDNEEKF